MDFIKNIGILLGNEKYMGMLFEGLGKTVLVSVFAALLLPSKLFAKIISPVFSAIKRLEISTALPEFFTSATTRQSAWKSFAKVLQSSSSSEAEIIL